MSEEMPATVGGRRDVGSFAVAFDRIRIECTRCGWTTYASSSLETFKVVHACTSEPRAYVYWQLSMKSTSVVERPKCKAISYGLEIESTVDEEGSH